jgi:nucleotide-binding universal stress UspA family protein
MNWWFVLLAIAFLAAVFVVAPVVAATFSFYRRPLRLRCPAEGTDARVVVDASRAAIDEARGRAVPEVERCSLWPRLRLCRQECLNLPATEVRAVPPGAPAPHATIRKILVPLDGSLGSESVLWTVGQLARVQGARVRLVHVAPAPGARWADDDTVIAFADQETARVEYEESVNLQRAVDELEGVDVERAVRFGDDPARAIVEEAEASGADLIAMATHRRVGLTRVLKGSVAERVESATTVPVILVPYGVELLGAPPSSKAPSFRNAPGRSENFSRTFLFL